MTAHELGRRLLAGGDYNVYIQLSGAEWGYPVDTNTLQSARLHPNSDNSDVTEAAVVISGTTSPCMVVPYSRILPR